MRLYIPATLGMRAWGESRCIWRSASHCITALYILTVLKKGLYIYIYIVCEGVPCTRSARGECRSENLRDRNMNNNIDNNMNNNMNSPIVEDYK